MVMLLLGLTWFVSVAGCDRDTQELAAASTRDMRIVTLAPAISQMLVDMDMGDKLVGVSEWDMAAPKGLPVVGNFTDVQTEAMLEVAPTHVLMMVGKEGAPTQLQRLADEGAFTLTTWNYPHTIADVADIVYQQGSEHTLGAVLQAETRAQRLRQDMLAKLDAIRAATAELPRRRTLVVIGSQPLMASGPGTVNHELIAIAGGSNAAAEATVRAPVYDNESLLALAPEVIVLMMPGSGPLSENDQRLGAWASLPIPANEQGRVTLINDPLAVLPSTSLPRIAAELAKAIHPEHAHAIDRALAMADAQTQPTSP